MNISSIQPRAIGEPGGRRYVVLKVATDTGHVGFGEAPALPSPKIAVAAMNRELATVVGRNVSQYVRIDRDLQRESVSATSRAALNVALMDILAKSCESPLYEMLGGPTRDKARAMAVVDGATTQELTKSVRMAKQAGHRAFSIPLSVPSGLERGRSFFTRARQQMDELRSAAGDECDFVLDCAGRTTPADALGLADRLEDFHLLWLDEPVADVNVATQASVSSRTVTPLGSGRHIEKNSRFQDLLREDAIDVLRPDIARNGITNILKAAAIAETYYIAVAPYNRGGPISTAAGIHLSAALANSFIQETPFPSEPAARRARREIAGGWDESPIDGYYQLLEGPGLGLRLDEAALETYTIGQ